MAKALVPGGAYLSADGTWHDANGKPIENPLKGAVTETPPPAGEFFTESSTAVVADAPVTAEVEPSKKAAKKVAKE